MSILNIWSQFFFLFMLKNLAYPKPGITNPFFKIRTAPVSILAVQPLSLCQYLNLLKSIINDRRWWLASHLWRIMNCIREELMKFIIEFIAQYTTSLTWLVTKLSSICSKHVCYEWLSKILDYFHVLQVIWSYLWRINLQKMSDKCPWFY